MIFTREQLKFGFGSARFDVSLPEERIFLAWVFNQFLYGEVTGIQCGLWLYQAPSLNAAQFIAKQATEELAHVRKILRILTLLKEKPAHPHWAVRFLATGAMGQSWGEHVTLEMALGEGLVLQAFYAMAETIDQPEIQKILEQAITEEERHVAFGERACRQWLEKNPGDRAFLLAQAYLQQVALRGLRRSILKRLQKEPWAQRHPVLRQFDAFYSKSVKMMDVRIVALGLSARPIEEFTYLQWFFLLTRFFFRKSCGWASRFFRKTVRALSLGFLFKQTLLTDTYLNDPVVQAEATQVEA